MDLPTFKLSELRESVNINEMLDEDVSDEIGAKVKTDFNTDNSTLDGWRKRHE